MTIEVDTEGFEVAITGVRRLREHRDRIGRHLSARMAQAFREKLGFDGERVSLIEVSSSERTVHGVAIEPEPKRRSIKELSGVALHLVVDAERQEWREVAEASPWVPEMVPVAPDKGKGTWVARNARSDEMAAIRQRNAKALERLGMEPLSAEAELFVETDAAYNAARAEFGLGPEGGDARWRPAMDALLDDRLPAILDGVIGDLANGGLDSGDLPAFEERSVEWWRRNQEFMAFVWGD